MIAAPLTYIYLYATTSNLFPQWQYDRFHEWTYHENPYKWIAFFVFFSSLAITGEIAINYSKRRDYKPSPEEKKEYLNLNARNR